jgi:hypothetical protein
MEMVLGGCVAAPSQFASTVLTAKMSEAKDVTPMTVFDPLTGQYITITLSGIKPR